MNEDLDYSYTQTSSVLGGEKTSSPDSDNVSIIKKRLNDTQKKIKDLSNVNSLDRNEKYLTLQQQLELVQYKLEFLKAEELELIEKVKELSNG